VQALLKGRFGITYDPEHKPDISPEAWGVLNRDAKWFRGNLEGAKTIAPSNATPEKIVQFYSWFRHKFPKAALPQAQEKIMGQWASFELEYVKKQDGSKPPISPVLDRYGRSLDRFSQPDYKPVPPPFDPAKEASDAEQ
jgi:hypothetical protein